jgi:UDP-3-O-[3-hydroxymyristoyl] glucosamine N-acyltransferase
MAAFDLASLARALGARLSGDPAAVVRRLAPFDGADGDSVAVAAEKGLVAALDSCRAAAVVVPEGTTASGRNLLFVPDAKAALRTLLDLFAPPPRALSGVAPGAHVAPSAAIGEGAWVGPGAFVGDGAVLGPRSRIHPLAVVGEGAVVGEESEVFPAAVLYPGVTLGRRVRIHAGTVVGADGFGYHRGPDGVQRKIPQIGTVTVGDDVEVGANAALDRATIGATAIGVGTKIDNLVQVGHNTTIGEHGCLIAQSGVAGSAKLGRFCVIAGQAGISDHVVLADGTIVGAQAGVPSDLDGGVWLGSPALPVRQARRVFPVLAKLPETTRRVRELEERVAALEAALAEGRRPAPPGEGAP